MQVNRTNAPISPNFNGFIHFSNFKHNNRYKVSNCLGRELKLESKDLIINTDVIRTVEPLNSLDSFEPRGAFIKTSSVDKYGFAQGFIIPESNSFSDICIAIQNAVTKGFEKLTLND